ncbi:Protein of unknown function [Bacillus toyonensis]|nr:Protein of unknown function [Bacillus toyonensis]
MEKEVKTEVIKIIAVTVVGVILILSIPYLFNYFS